MRKLALLTCIALLTAVIAHAGIKIETCIEDHIPNTNCYKIQVSVINDDPETGRTLVAQGSTWVGSDCKKNGHREIPNRNPDCPPVSVGNDIDIYTTGDHCLTDVMDDEMSAAIVASINDLLAAPIAAAKGIKAPVAVFGVFPNPAHGYITVATHIENASSATMHIVDMAGKEVSVTQIQNASASRSTLLLKDIAPGLYTIVLKSGGEILASQRLTIQ
jgi:hypothetical protein